MYGNSMCPSGVLTGSMSCGADVCGVRSRSRFVMIGSSRIVESVGVQRYGSSYGGYGGGYGSYGGYGGYGSSMYGGMGSMYGSGTRTTCRAS